MTIGSLSRIAAAVDAALNVELRWQGADLDRLTDTAHAALQTTAARRVSDAGWLARPEVSFNHYGDRGRCDLLAWHPGTRTLLVVEVKSSIGDLQDTLGRLDTKARLGEVLAEQVGWGRPAHVVPALVLREDRTARRVVTKHEPLFRRYGTRGRTALAWLQAPTATSGLIWFESADADHRRVITAQRVRTARPAG